MAAASILALGSAAAVPPPAEAAVASLACTINVQLSFSPPLTAVQTSASVVAVASLSNCLSPNGSQPQLAGGVATPVTGTVSSLGGVPCNLLLTITGSGVIEWSPGGEQTTFDFTVRTNVLDGTVQLTTWQTGGTLAGTTSQTVGAANPNLDCLLNGLSGLAVPVAVTTFL
ncbi:hypothetical protein ABZ816_30535 [Actinosynnema sp. NPDC047251]|uniref:hypothetical protein n=1 Tax=Saccharothrix espanaensis TaxID=103731 RepID=UPI0002E06FD9|nr:hypothetical protein [Saccharothrix espanaensis]